MAAPRTAIFAGPGWAVVRRGIAIAIPSRLTAARQCFVFAKRRSNHSSNGLVGHAKPQSDS